MFAIKLVKCLLRGLLLLVKQCLLPAPDGMHVEDGYSLKGDILPNGSLMQACVDSKHQLVTGKQPELKHPFLLSYSDWSRADAALGG